MENVRQVRSVAILYLLEMLRGRKLYGGTKPGSYHHGYFMLCFDIRFLHIFSSPVRHFIFQQSRRWVSCQLPDADTQPGNRFHAPMFVYIINVNTEQWGNGDWDDLGHDGMPSDKRTRQVAGTDEASGTPSDHRRAGHLASHRNGTLRLVTPSILATIEPTK